MDDSELLKAYATEKSEAAFAELVRRHLDLVYSAALRQVGGDPHRAQEVAQGVFTDLARKAHTVANHPALAGWLYTSTRYAATKLMRSERRHRFHEEQAAAAAACEPSEPDWQQLRPILDEAMHELGETERNALVLRFFERRPMTEVGRILGLSESGARKSVERGLARLRVQLNRRGIASAPAALSLALASHTVNSAPQGLATAISEGALAAATTGGGILTLSLMSTIKLQAGIAVTLVAVAGGFWFSQQRQLSRIREENADAQRSIAQIDAETKALTRGAADLRAEVDRSAGASKSDLAAAETLPKPTVDPAVDFARKRATLDQSYAGLFRRLKLDPPRLEQLRDRLTERSIRSLAVRRYAVSATGQWIDEWANKTEELDYIAAGTRDIDEQIRGLIGEEKYAHYASYERTLPWRATFNELATVLEPLDPLSEEQIDQLTSWAAAADPNFFVDRAKSGPRIPAEVVTRAGQILTPLQFEKLGQAQAASEAYRQMLMLNKMAIQREANAPANTPP